MNSEHYYTEKPTSELKKFELTTSILGFDLKFHTGTGTFCYTRIDRATEILLSYMKVSPGMNVLDLGCGWGPIGVILAKLGCNVVMSDVNERALMLAEDNVKINKVNAKVVKSDLFQKIPESFDSIITNPPIAKGLPFNFRLIEESFKHLKIGGSLQLVARHNKGGSRLEEHMNKIFGNVSELCKKGGFRVYFSGRKA